MGADGVAVVSRSDARHPAYLEQLVAEGVTATAEVADVLDGEQLNAALARIQDRLGPIEVLYFGPAAMDPASLPVPIVQVTGAAVRDGFALVPAAADAVAAVLPGMLERGRGTILLPTGLSAIRPMPELGNLAITSAALRSYALTLNAAVADQGVFVGSLVIGGGIRGGDIHTAMTARSDQFAGTDIDAEALARLSLDPDEIADRVYDLSEQRTEPERIFSVIAELSA
ncbi:SDR family NAD(P)-dependent oxidoreductase [Microlunatus elymi]|uniref:SDR family NAD(P)-dependent oxidoreductase n=1 Tax=Microlunatus elymi TaxID=2596828 RepID=A0A516Q276_9ACTN|nr:SDR family NAD(P)-dependent oxidoreductase [Microlunatus elymi]QDP97534.1 SDR family NAD(P)-dependent oxidoreductase [Microlunatus elymi]